jgi:hypothetical protein
LKTVRPERVSGVRIPPPPPFSQGARAYAVVDVAAAEIAPSTNT